MANFIVVVDQEFVRDAQIIPNPVNVDNESEWIDAFGHFVLGVYEGQNEDDVITKVVEERGFLETEILRAYQLQDMKQVNKTPLEQSVKQEIEFIIYERNPDGYTEEAVEFIEQNIEEITNEILGSKEIGRQIDDFDAIIYELLESMYGKGGIV